MPAIQHILQSNEEALAILEDRQVMKIIQQRHHWTGQILRHQSLLLVTLEKTNEEKT